jgi:lipopolysaccharide export LptBFGC system permease protein LptF
VDIVLDDTIRRTVDPSGEYDVASFQQLILSIDPSTVIPVRGPASKGLPEMTVPELKAAAAEKEREGASSHNEWAAIHQKFAIPFACVVFGVIGLALGATHRRDGTMGSFVLGLVVVFAYYIPLYLGPQLVKGDMSMVGTGKLNPGKLVHKKIGLEEVSGVLESMDKYGTVGVTVIAKY